MNVEIKQLMEKDAQKWDAFVQKCPYSTFYHQSAWKKVIEETYGHKAFYLYAENKDREVVGILPLFLIRNVLFFKKQFISVPFAPYAGVCCEDQEAGDALINEAISLGRKLDVDYCELRQYRNFTPSARYDFTNYYVTSVLTLSETPEETLNNLTRNKRKTVYKSQKNNLTFGYFSENNTIFDEFHRIYSVNMKILGSPHHGEKFFRNILKYTNSDIVCVFMDGRSCYAAMILFFKDTVIDFMSSAFVEDRKYYVTDFGIWNIIEKAHQSGYKYIDFGRSISNSDNLEFKRRWGAETIPLEYLYPVTKKIDLGKLQPSNYTKYAEVWSRMPATITNIIGPKLRGYIT
jgi:FemAB-related protein (PEP-CTERM system-associated)